MNSKKRTSNNPLMDPNHVTQKYTVAGEYNELFDDVQALTDTTYTTLEADAFTAVQNATGIKDYGLGNVISVVGKWLNADLGPTGLPGSDAGRVVVPLTSWIKSIHYTGTGQLTYTLGDSAWDPDTKVGGSPSTNPEEIFILYNLDYLGFQVQGLTVTDGTLTCECWLYANIQDPLAIGGA